MRRIGHASAALALLALGACGAGDPGPASQRGFFGGLFAWVGGGDRAQASALEAEALRREQALVGAQRRADIAQADIARSQGETIAAQRFARSPSAAGDLLRETARSLDQVNTQGRQRLETLAEQDRAFRRGLLPEARLRSGQQEARSDLDAISIWMAQAEGMAGQLMPAARTNATLRAPLAELQEQRAKLGSTAVELHRAIAALP